jgi:hypothetical protein
MTGLENERLLYLPDEAHVGDQVGPRRAFEQLVGDGRLGAYEAFSPDLKEAASVPSEARARLVELAASFQPTIILWSHPGAFPVTRELLLELRSVGSSPTVVLQDMDAWGMLRKRLSTSVRVRAKDANLVYTSRTGSHRRVYRQAGAQRTRYCFDGFDAARFGTPWSPPRERTYDVVMVANRCRGRLPGTALPCALRRARLARLLEQQYGSRFALYGSGWEGYKSWLGPLTFAEQGNANRSAWVSVSWDHFPSISHCTSNRVPISLASGVPHVTNHQAGYEQIYPQGSGLYWGKSVRAVAEMVTVLLAMPKNELLALGESAANLARVHRSRAGNHGAPPRGRINVQGHCWD